VCSFELRIFVDEMQDKSRNVIEKLWRLSWFEYENKESEERNHQISRSGAPFDA